jgi:hypothetical protein
LNSKTKNAKNIFAFIFVIALVLCLFVSSGNSQEFRDYLLKRIGNLYILNVGANDNVKQYKVYNLFFEESRRFPLFGFKLKSDRNYFGAVQVSQLFPNYCVVRVVARYMEEEPEGNIAILVKKQLPEELLARAYAVSGIELPEEKRIREEEIKREIAAAPEGETIVKQTDTELRDSSYRPYSLSINYFHDFDQISQPITDNIAAVVNEGVYNNTGSFSSSFSAKGGISINLGKMITPRLVVQGGLSYITQNSDLKTSQNPDIQFPKGLIRVENWDFSIRSTVTNWSLSVQLSDFSKALSFFTGEPAGRPYSPRFGIGIDRAAVSGDIEHSVNIYKYDGSEPRTLSESFSMGSYMGMHATAGIDYYKQAARFFVEINYQRWFTEKFKSNFPIRAGAAIFF